MHNQTHRWWGCRPQSKTAVVGGSTAAAPAGAVLTLPKHSQCGGAGGACAGALCKDEPFAGYKCEAGLSCMRQNR
jgi:hypothetical protein